MTAASPEPSVSVTFVSALHPELYVYDLGLAFADGVLTTTDPAAVAVLRAMPSTMQVMEQVESPGVLPPDPA